MELLALWLIKGKVDSTYIYSAGLLLLGGGVWDWWVEAGRGKGVATKACEAADNGGDNRFDRQNVAQADKFAEILQRKITINIL